MENKELKFTKEFYNREVNIERYGKAIDDIGLWNSEKIIFSKYFKKTDNILDLGCGAGRTTINLYRDNYKNIIGLDISNKLIEYANIYCEQKELDINFVVGDATNLKYDSNSFDCVIFSFNGMQCIPGFENRLAVLKEVYRVLKPGGYYIFTAHNRDDSGNYNKFWEEELLRWNTGTNDERMEIYGDLYTIDPTGEEAFIHFSNIDEMKKFINNTDFTIIEYKLSTLIEEENKKEVDNLHKTVFWVLRK